MTTHPCTYIRHPHSVLYWQMAPMASWEIDTIFSNNMCKLTFSSASAGVHRGMSHLWRRCWSFPVSCYIWICRHTMLFGQGPNRLQEWRCVYANVQRIYVWVADFRPVHPVPTLPNWVRDLDCDIKMTLEEEKRVQKPLMCPYRHLIAKLAKLADLALETEASASRRIVALTSRIQALYKYTYSVPIESYHSPHHWSHLDQWHFSSPCQMTASRSFFDSRRWRPQHVGICGKRDGILLSSSGAWICIWHLVLPIPQHEDIRHVSFTIRVDPSSMIILTLQKLVKNIVSL